MTFIYRARIKAIQVDEAVIPLHDIISIKIEALNSSFEEFSERFIRFFLGAQIENGKIVFPFDAPSLDILVIGSVIEFSAEESFNRLVDEQCAILHYMFEARLAEINSKAGRALEQYNMNIEQIIFDLMPHMNKERVYEYK